MRIVVTGASGRLGRQLMPLMAREAESFGIARRPASTVTHCVNLNDVSRLNNLLDSLAPDCILHASALADVDACESELADAYAANVRTTANIADWVVSRRPQTRLVLVSTDQVYDAPGPSTESAAQPRNIYALTKLWSEDVVRRTDNHLILRTNFFGAATPGDDGQVGWLVGRIHSGMPASLFSDVQFNPLYVSDLCAILAELATGTVRGTFNLGSRGGMSKAAFFRSLATALGLPTDMLRDGSVTDLQLKAYRPRDMRMDVSAMETALRRDLPSLQESITRLAQEWREANL